MARKRKKPAVPDNQIILIKAEASYPRRWQGIRSKRPYESQVRGTMFEKGAEENQLEMFAHGGDEQSSDTGMR